MGICKTHQRESTAMLPLLVLVNKDIETYGKRKEESPLSLQTPLTERTLAQTQYERQLPFQNQNGKKRRQEHS